MSGFLLQEIIGGIGQGIVLVTFALNGESRIRICALIGCVFFLMYGALLGTPTMIATNIILIVLHLYKLRKLRKISHQKKV